MTTHTHTHTRTHTAAAAAATTDSHTHSLSLKCYPFILLFDVFPTFSAQRLDNNIKFMVRVRARVSVLCLSNGSQADMSDVKTARSVMCHMTSQVYRPA